MTETRKLAAILVADIVGYSRLAGADEEGILPPASALRSDLVDPPSPCIAAASSSAPATAVLIEFRSVVDAVRCAIEVQSGMVERNAGAAGTANPIPRRHSSWRRGRGERRRPDGRGVNIAARLEGVCSRGRSVSPKKPTGRSKGGSTSR